MPDHLACRIDSDQGKRGQPSLVGTKLIEQRHLDRDLIRGFGASERRDNNGPDGTDVAWVFPSYQHKTMIRISRDCVTVTS